MRSRTTKRKKALSLIRAATRSFRQQELERSFHTIRNRPFTRGIITRIAELRRQIAADATLARDFEFFIKKTGWHPERLLLLLYWDCNMMHADLQTILSGVKCEVSLLDRQTVSTVLRNLAELPDKIAHVNETEFSPARTRFLRDCKGTQLHPKQQKDLQDSFSRLPDVLRFYHVELKRKFDLADQDWHTEEKEWKFIVDVTRRRSMYEEIRAATRDNKYNANRLCRLLNASRAVQGLQPINLRAFIVWLNKLRRRHNTQAAVSTF
jgi:hypothetical protein